MTYDREKAVAYAHKWAYSRNPAYYNFDNAGGDCTSFISQCLYAGCGVMNFKKDVGWYYRSSYDRAAGWSGVPYLRQFLITNRNAGPYASEVPLGFAQPGDILQLSFNGLSFGHSLFVVAVRPALLIATHTLDSDNRPLDTYQFQLVRLLHIEGVRP